MPYGRLGMLAGNWILIIGFSALVFLVMSSLLFALMIVSDEAQLRIDRRVNRYIVRIKKRGPNLAIMREQQRNALFAEFDRRWQNRSFFKSLQNYIQAAQLDI